MSFQHSFLQQAVFFRYIFAFSPFVNDGCEINKNGMQEMS